MHHKRFVMHKMLTTVKDGLIRYSNTKTSRNGVNIMWIVKKFHNPMTNWMSVEQHQFRHTTFRSTLYTSIPHNLLKSRITELVHNSFKRRDGSNRYTHIKIASGKGYFIDAINLGGDNIYTADQICRMVEFFIDNIMDYLRIIHDNIFVKFGGCIMFGQVIGIPMGMNCAPPLPPASRPLSLLL